MPTAELTVKPGPSGWVEVNAWRGDSNVGMAWVNFKRPRGGRWQPTALFVLNPSDAAVRAISMYRIVNAVNASARIKEELAGRLQEPIALLGSPDFIKAFRGYGHYPEPIVLERPSGRRLDDSFYTQVADAYRAAATRGLNPRTEIAKAAGVSTDVAGRWVREARKRRFLAETTPGKVTA